MLTEHCNGILEMIV